MNKIISIGAGIVLAINAGVIYANLTTEKRNK
jgi:hypothetical protein